MHRCDGLPISSLTHTLGRGRLARSFPLEGVLDGRGRRRALLPLAHHLSLRRLDLRLLAHEGSERAAARAAARPLRLVLREPLRAPMRGDSCTSPSPSPRRRASRRGAPGSPCRAPTRTRGGRSAASSARAPASRAPRGSRRLAVLERRELVGRRRVRARRRGLRSSVEGQPRGAPAEAEEPGSEMSDRCAGAPWSSFSSASAAAVGSLNDSSDADASVASGGFDPPQQVMKAGARQKSKKIT